MIPNYSPANYTLDDRQKFQYVFRSWIIGNHVRINGLNWRLLILAIQKKKRLQQSWLHCFNQLMEKCEQLLTYLASGTFWSTLPVIKSVIQISIHIYASVSMFCSLLNCLFYSISWKSMDHRFAKTETSAVATAV